MALDFNQQLLADLQAANMALINEISELRAEHKEEVQALNQQIANLTETLNQFKDRFFGASSEKSKQRQMEGQLSLEDLLCTVEDAPELPEEIPTAEDYLAEHTPAGTPSQPERKPRSCREDLIAADVPREKRLIPLSEEQKLCDECGTELTHMGEVFDHSEVEITLAQVNVVDYYRETGICKECKADGTTLIKQSTPPVSLLPHSMASPSIVAYIIYMKYINAVPLNRLEAEFIRMGLRLDRSVQANWVNTCALTYLKPIFDYLYEELMGREVIMSDETVCQVHREAGKKNSSNSYMWIYRSGEDGLPPIILYEYQPGRSGKYAEEFLKEFSGYHHCDGYSGYNGVTNVTRIACLAHIRRKFIDALPANRIGKTLTPAEEGVLFCNKLFELERAYKEYPPADLKQTRLKYSKPVLEAFWCWLDQQDPPAGSNLYKAVTYARNQKEYMNNFLKDSRLSISNSLTENSVRPYTLIRKNSLFHDTPKGATASAIICSLIETAKASNLDVLKYFEYVLTEMRGYNGQPEGMEWFAPWTEQMQQLCGLKPINNG